MWFTATLTEKEGPQVNGVTSPKQVGCSSMGQVRMVFFQGNVLPKQETVLKSVLCSLKVAQTRCKSTMAVARSHCT